MKPIFVITLGDIVGATAAVVFLLTVGFLLARDAWVFRRQRRKKGPA